MKLTKRIVCLAAMVVLAASLPAFACTGLMVKAQDGSIVRARTMEFGSTLQSDIIIVPRGYHFAAAEGSPESLQWNGKYALAATNPLGMPSAVDGVNEKGLSGGIFYFPEYASSPKPGPDKKTLGLWDAVTYALSMATTAEEAAQAVISAGVSSFVVKEWGIKPPAHYLFTDATGKSVVLEFTASGSTVYQSPLGWSPTRPPTTGT